MNWTLRPALGLPLLSAAAAALAAYCFGGFETEALYLVGGVVLGASVSIFYTRYAVLPICIGAGFLFGTRIPVHYAVDQIFPLFLLLLVVFNSVMRWNHTSDEPAS
jgi:hypothetical protein